MIVVVIPGLTSIFTISDIDSPWVEAVATVIIFLLASAETTFDFIVVKLWFCPVPMPVRYNSPLFEVVLVGGTAGILAYFVGTFFAI